VNDLLTERIPYEGRLNRAVQGFRMQQQQARLVAELAREVDQPMPSPQASLPGDPQRLRGLPAVGGRGSIGGHIRGTSPHIDAFGQDRGAIHSLATLVRDEIDGSSPGTQPEQALLEAEAEEETERLLRERGRLDTA
jgi:hypothetical protein